MALIDEFPYETQISVEPAPWLALSVMGPNGFRQLFLGLVDSGADYTTMPLEMAGLLGYRDDELLPRSVRGVAGGAGGLLAQQPTRARIPDYDEDFVIELRPLFAQGGQYILWGRADFFIAFSAITFNGPAERLSLFAPDPAI